MDHGRTCIPEDSTTRKRVYTAPTLVCHGQISDLTQAGSKGPTEATPGGPCTGGGLTDKARKACAPSDVRLKDNIRRVGEYSPGIALYLFEYKSQFKAPCGAGTYLGVMAQDVLPVLPSAVVRGANGYYAVDYTELHQLRH
jgi:hypothetical protein